MSLPEALERAATELASDAGAIRPANGDPIQLLDSLDAEGAVRVLGWLLENDLEAGEELALSWSEDDRGLVPLQQIDERSLPKPGRKVLRRILHRLRSGGVELEAKLPAAPRVSRLPEISEEIDDAFVSLVDSRGSYLVYLVERHPTSGARLFQVALDEQRGVLDFKVYSAGRSKLRKFLRELTGGGAGAVVSADSERVRALVRRIADAHPADRTLPRNFGEWRRKLLGAAGDATTGDQAREGLGAGSGEEGVARIVSRVEAGDVGPWPPEPGLFGEVASRLESRFEKVAELSRGEREAEIELALAEAGEAIFGEAHTLDTARRFEESAFVLWKSDREEEAADCLAAATALRGDAGGADSIIRVMTRISCSSLIEPLESKNDEAGDSDPDSQQEAGGGK